MLLILWIGLGIGVGSVVSLVVTRQQKAWPLDVLLGVLGSVVAGKMSVLTETNRNEGPGPGNLVVATAGAIAIVVAYRALTGRRHA
jgi:uncharacterized membrane protein YeaQ/YmgE (transglycosylase-associated protein family)